MFTSETAEQPVFDYRTLRLLVGNIAFALPLLVLIFSSFIPLTSISVSYHTDARNIFVGSLFMIGALLVAYQGHGRIENWLANLGAVAAIVAALCPASCELCCKYCEKTEPVAALTANIHLLAGAILFSVIAYFSLGPFIQRAKAKLTDKAKRRIKVYTVCGWVIIACILVALIAQIPAIYDIKIAWMLVFWAELFSLWAFGIAWIVASKFITWTTDDDEKLHLSLDLNLVASNWWKFWNK